MNNKKVFKVILCSMLVLALVISNFAGLDLGFVKAYAQEPVAMQGSGSKEDPYQITNYAQLKEFAGIVNGGQTDACAKLMNDIVCTDKLWEPIGNINNKYNGHFNDNDEEIKKIIGLNNTGFNDVNDKNYQGLFGCIGRNGIVKNIGIEGGEIKGKDFIGGVAGVNYGTITNCYNTGLISGSGDNAYVGGVAGRNYGTITNCYNTGSISAGGDDSWVGGVAGYNKGGTITNCYNTGSISGGDNAYVGGVAGRNEGTITNCYNTGSISGSGAYAYVGGVAGKNERTITNCYNTGSISGSGANAYVGGVAGRNLDGTITNCYNTGLISAGGANARVGGVAGRNDGTITNCYYDINRSGVSKAVSNQDDSDTVKGLRMDKMTDSNALEKMAFVKSIEINGETINLDNWITKANDAENGYSFYPHLKGFNFDSDDKQLNAADIEPGNWPGRDFKLSGAGTETSPYKIENYDELKEFADVVNGTGKYKENQNTSACAILKNDIVCFDKLWLPIGYYNSNTDNALYSGQFDGNNKKIIGLNNTGFNDVNDKSYQGLFGYIGSNGFVKNIGIEGGEIKGVSYIGGVAGYNDGGTITNCYNKGSISGSGISASVGGVAGANGGRITNCYNTGSISGGAGAYVGGVAGAHNGRITNCYNTGSISGGAGADVGGVVGFNLNGFLTNCYNTGSIIGGDNAKVGGVAGDNYYGDITNCYNTGSIIGGDNARVGGVTGYKGSGNINNCYYNKDILGDIKGINGADTDTVKGLTTAEMTGKSANGTIKMQFVYDDPTKNPWIIKDDDVTENSFKWYYPHLIGFEFDNEGNIITEAEKITNWPTYAKGTVMYTEPESYEYNGLALYPEPIVKIGDDTYPENAIATYFKQDAEGKWKKSETSDKPTTPGVYRISIKINEIDENVTYKYFSILDTVNTYLKKAEDGTWGELSGYSECIDAGMYRIKSEFSNDGHSPIIKDFLILPKELTVVAVSGKSKEYGSTDPTLTYTASGFVTGEDSIITGALSRAEGENVGTYAITLGTLSAGTNYKINFTSADFAINTKSINSDAMILSNSEYTYDGTAKTPGVKIVDGTTEIPDDEYIVEITNNIDAGTATVTVTDNANGNYNVSSGTKSFTINRAEAKVKADDITITYGDAIPDLTATISGIVAADENKQNLITYTVSRDEGNDVGTYTITPSGEAVQGNYTVKYETGTLTIIKQLAGITKNPDAVKSLVYDGNNQELVTSGTPEDGITIYYALGADNITAPAPDADAATEKTWNTVIPSAKDAGTYYVWFKAVADDNHSTDDEAACLPVIISRASVTVTADDKTKSFGAVDEALTATVSGLKGTDTADMITYTLSRAEGENAGTYAITPAGDAEQGNYTVTYVPGTFTITTSTESVYDITLSQDTYTYDGTEKVPTVTISTGATTIPATEYEVTITNNINAGTATVTVIDVAGGNYNVSGTAAYTIEKADPAYTVPTGLTALTGKTLSDVSLPNGWTWMDKDVSVGAAGENTFKAVYKPEDTVNYNTVEDIDVVVTVSEPAPDPTPAIIPDPAPVIKPQPAPEPEVKEPELPYTTNETVTNKDGSVTKIETTFNKDGSKTETSVREYTNGNKTTKLTLTNDKGVNLIKASEAIKTNKKGTKTVSTNIQAVNGYNYQSEVKTTKLGKKVSEVKITNADKSSSYEKTVTYPDGNITKNSVKTKADGTADVTFGKYVSGTSVADGKNDISSSYSGSISGKDKSAAEAFVSDILAGMTPSSGVIGSAVFGTFGSKVDDTTISDMLAKVSGSITAPDTSLPADAETVEELRYTTTSDKNAKLVKCITASEKVTIPSRISINGTSYTVTTIGKNAFKKAPSVKCLVLGKTITKFGKKAFNGISKDAIFVMRVKSATRTKIARLIKKSGYTNAIQVLYSVNK